MTKIRKISSIENGLAEVVKILSEEEILHAIGKSGSYLRKCSNPDQPQQIDHNDSFKLDKACIKKGKSPPLLTVHEYMISQESNKLDENKPKNIDDMLVKFTILHGKLTELVKKSQDPESDQGSKITPLEKKDIFDAITALENKVFKLKITVDKRT